jgi:hypothetical protein
LSSLNHFTLPVAIAALQYLCAAQMEDAGATTYGR